VSDPLIDRLDRLSESTRQSFRDFRQKYDQSAAGIMQAEVSAFTRFWFQIMRASHWIWINILRQSCGR